MWTTLRSLTLAPTPYGVRITDAYLASALRAFAQIRPIGRTSDMPKTLYEMQKPVQIIKI